MTNLPPIPDEAKAAFVEAGKCRGHASNGLPDSARYFYRDCFCGCDTSQDACWNAAWPHLYAAALRHAAEELDRRQTPDNSHESERDPALWLNRMADEVTR